MSDCVRCDEGRGPEKSVGTGVATFQPHGKQPYAPIYLQFISIVQNCATSVGKIGNVKKAGTSTAHKLSFKTNPRQIGPVVSENEAGQT